jgi:hypothetical protein
MYQTFQISSFTPISWTEKSKLPVRALLITPSYVTDWFKMLKQWFFFTINQGTRIVNELHYG